VGVRADRVRGRFSYSLSFDSDQQTSDTRRTNLYLYPCLSRVSENDSKP
jgi:hypothetical protein